MSYPKNHHYVPACYLKHFAIPPRRTGELFAYDRVTGETSSSSPHEVARQLHFYTVEVHGESPALAEDTYAKLENRFSPTLSGVVERGALPTEPTAMRELIAFVATQALRTPRVRAMQRRFYGDVHMLPLRVLAANKAAFMKHLRQMDDDELRELSDEEAEQLFVDLVKHVSAPGARIEIPQTRLVADVFEVSAEVEEVLARRHWILGVAPDDAQFITSDDPVRLEWAMLSGREPRPSTILRQVERGISEQ